MNNAPPDILVFVGRLHVLLVHLPIGMLALLAAMELTALVPRFKTAQVNASAGFVLAMVAPLAVVTAICGWFLSLSGGYAETLLAWHKWLGITVAAGCILTAALFRLHKSVAYRVSLFATAGLLMAAGHLGGSLTHGSDFLTRYAPWPLKELLPASAEKEQNAQPNPTADRWQLPVFAGVIAPVFHDKCVMCHGPEKSKAKMRLDSYAGVLRGSENGAVVKPGNADQSPMIKRISLPAASDDHMPPSGKPQLTASEIALLKWWINAGAPETNTLAELQPPADIQAIIAGGMPGSGKK